MLNMASLAFLSLSLVSLACVALKSTPAEASMAPAAEPVLQAENRAAPQPDVLVVEQPGYQLQYPAQFEQHMPVEQVCELIDGCIERIEALFGPFEKRIYIGVPGRISGGPDFPAHLTIQGVTFVDDAGDICVLVALPALGPEVMTHELCHARLRDLGLDPPRWLEEGMAEFVEQPDGFLPGFARLLAEHGQVSDQRLAEDEGVADDEMQLRATAWAMVYHLVNEQGLELKEVATLRQFPSTIEAALTVFRTALMRAYGVLDTISALSAQN